MSLKQITAEEALRKAAAGKNVYILRPINEKTTVAELFNALAFAEKIQDEEKHQEKPEEDPEEEEEEVAVQEEAPADKSGKRSKVDHKKILALRTAGWSVRKISEEMDISQQTVRNHLKEEDL